MADERHTGFRLPPRLNELTLEGLIEELQLIKEKGEAKVIKVLDSHGEWSRINLVTDHGYEIRIHSV